MATYIVKYRKTSPLTVEEIEADDREHAIAQTIATAEEGGSVDVLMAQEGPPDVAVPSKK